MGGARGGRALGWEGWDLGICLLQSPRTQALMGTTFFSRVLEVWMQLAVWGHAQHTDVTHCWQRLLCLLRTYWVQWRPTHWRQTQAQGMNFSRGHLLHLMDTPNFLIQVRWAQVCVHCVGSQMVSALDGIVIPGTNRLTDTT